MTEYRKQAEFLKSLLMYEDIEEHRILCERLAAAERNERCLLCACRLVMVVALVGMAGIGYSAVLLPQFFDNSTHVVVQFFSALGLGSLMCLAAFFGLWVWYRRAMNRVHEECRLRVGTMLESRLKTTVTAFCPVVVSPVELPAPGTTSAQSGLSPGTDFWSLPKAS